MTASWCVCPVTSNDHEPLIAHPGSYDADRCIHRNDHGQPRGRLTAAGRQAAVLAVVVTIAKGYDLGYIWKTKWAKLHLMQHWVRGGLNGRVGIADGELMLSALRRKEGSSAGARRVSPGTRTAGAGGR